MQLILGLILLGLLNLVRAKVVSVPARDPSIILDQYWVLEENELGCGPIYYTEIPKSVALFNFTGTAVSVLGSMSARGGVYDVYLDSILQATVDRYTPSAKDQCGYTVFSKTGLSDTQHALRLSLRTNSTQWRPGSGDGRMDFTEIQYTVPDSVETPNVGPGKKKKSAPVGAIAGGVVGGIVVLGAAAIGLWYFLVKRPKKIKPYGKVDLEEEKDGPFGPHGLDRRGSTMLMPVAGYEIEPFQWDPNAQPASVDPSTSATAPGPSSGKPMRNANSPAHTSPSQPTPDQPNSAQPIPAQPTLAHLTEKTTTTPSQSPDSSAHAEPQSPTGAPPVTHARIPEGLPENDIQRIAQAILDKSAVVDHRRSGLPPYTHRPFMRDS
ncbi:hypothetical protein FRC03_003560 [Tulasnella sp. 419]|nr:hypothetical protein FRC03_003560 [Tulasnella sp. 419]